MTNRGPQILEAPLIFTSTCLLKIQISRELCPSFKFEFLKSSGISGNASLTVAIAIRNKSAKVLREITLRVMRHSVEEPSALHRSPAAAAAPRGMSACSQATDWAGLGATARFQKVDLEKRIPPLGNLSFHMECGSEHEQWPFGTFDSNVFEVE
jgi:hypothetical protein